jgi:hypothetical protein
MSTLKVSTISPLGTDATKTITIGASGDVAAGVSPSPRSEEGDMNGSSDYLECFCDINGASGGGEIFQGYQRRTNFGAYRIIGA